MKVLIIGAGGMLAKPVIHHFDKAGYELRLFSRNVDTSMFDKAYEIVRGNALQRTDLERAIEGCDAIHISLANVNEALTTQIIVDVAKQHSIKCISIITGCTVCEENRWFRMIDNKFRAEKAIMESGIPYMIFRPTWFFESLDLMIRNGKATMIGKQPHPYHWVAADDYAQMVANAYQKPEAWCKIFYIFGPKHHTMADLLVDYCKRRFPEIKKVSYIPLGIIRLIAIISGNSVLKSAASMFGYFEKVKEMGDPTEASNLLGKPQTTYDDWLAKK